MTDSPGIGWGCIPAAGRRFVADAAAEGRPSRRRHSRLCGEEGGCSCPSRAGAAAVAGPCAVRVQRRPAGEGAAGAGTWRGAGRGPAVVVGAAGGLQRCAPCCEGSRSRAASGLLARSDSSAASGGQLAAHGDCCDLRERYARGTTGSVGAAQLACPGLADGCAVKELGTQGSITVDGARQASRRRLRLRAVVAAR